MLTLSRQLTVRVRRSASDVHSNRVQRLSARDRLQHAGLSVRNDHLCQSPQRTLPGNWAAQHAHRRCPSGSLLPRRSSPRRRIWEALSPARSVSSAIGSHTESRKSSMPNSFIRSAMRLVAAVVPRARAHARQPRLPIWSPATVLGSPSSRPRAEQRQSSTPTPTISFGPIRPIRLSEGIETPNFIKSLSFGKPGQRRQRTMSTTRTSSGCAPAAAPARSSCRSDSIARP